MRLWKPRMIYNNAAKVVNLFTYPIIVLCTTNPTPSSYKPLCKTITIYDNNEHTYHLIVIRYVTANKYIQKFWKQTLAGDASLCWVIITLFYITLILKIMLINVTYLDISVSNIPITPRHGLFCVCLQPIRTCVTILTMRALIGWAHTQNDPCKASKCIVV